jgi:hypothetical protein
MLFSPDFISAGYENLMRRIFDAAWVPTYSKGISSFVPMQERVF